MSTIWQWIQGRYRLMWGLCPTCNSGAPAVDHCPVCESANFWPDRFGGIRRYLIWKSFKQRGYK